MTKSKVIKHEALPDPFSDEYSRTVFGFWVYLLTDFMMFATIFAVYAVLHKNTFGGLGPRELFDLPMVLNQTWILLVATFFVGLGGASAHRNSRRAAITYFVFAFLLGVIFLWLQGCDMTRLIEQGATWKSNGFLSSYYTLIGTFDVHIIFGLLWTIVLIFPVMKRGLDIVSVRRLTCLRMFWQFLNIVWIFIFSVVYLIGVAE
jgi:cytochrome o ubiquinol oxidase subunit 3